LNDINPDLKEEW